MFVFLEQIFSSSRKTFMQYILVLDEQHGTLLRHCQQFVRVYHNRVSSFDSVQFGSMFLREKQTPSPSGIDVKPHIVPFTNIGNFVDRVERSTHCGACGKRKSEWKIAQIFIFLGKLIALFNALPFLKPLRPFVAVSVICNP